jgi:SAM-dependent methyltransferase
MMHIIRLVRLLIRQPYKLRLIRRVTGSRRGSIIDIGCGAGEFPLYLQSKGWTVQSIEPNADARTHCKSIGLQTDDMNALSSIPSQSFDAVGLWHVLEHVYDIHGTMETVRRLLKTDGAAFIALPHYNCPEARRYGPAWGGFELPRHPSHFTPTTLKRLASAHGLEVTEMHALNLDDVYLSLLSEKYAGGNIVRGLWRGLKNMMLSFWKTKNGSSIVYVLRPSIRPPTAGYSG